MIYGQKLIKWYTVRLSELDSSNLESHRLIIQIKIIKNNAKQILIT